MYNQQGAVLQLEGWAEDLKNPHCKKLACYEMSHSASDMADSCTHGNETWISIKGGKCDLTSDY